MMGNTSLEQAIYLAIDYIRKVQHKRPYSENIVDTVAKKYGLNETKVKKQLDHLVETGAIYITVKPGFHMIATVGDASPRQARGHIGDDFFKWKHFLNDVADVADQTGTVRGRIERVEMS